MIYGLDLEGVMASGAGSGRRRKAEKDSWNTKPMPEQHATLELNVQFKENDMEQIKLGFIPQEMEEKWFIYYIDNEDKLYLHRSWTGMCIFIVKFEKIGDSYAAVSAVVNRDPAQYKCTDDKQDMELCVSIIGAVLLGKYGFVGNPIESWSLLGKQCLPPDYDKH